MPSTRFFTRISSSFLPVCFVVAVALCAASAWAEEVGQGTFDGSLDPGAGCGEGFPATLGYHSNFRFDDKEFIVNIPPGNNQLHLNLSQLGEFHSNGTLDCVFDVGGTFTTITAINEAGDFEWIELDGEYLDHQPGISEGDVFPWVAGARCVTTRTDDFKTLCDNFELSWNGLSRMLAPNPGYSFFDGQLHVRTAPRVPVDPNPGDPKGEVNVGAPVDGPGGDVPDVAVSFKNGVVNSGELSISTLADAHGEVPSDAAFPIRGTTEIDHEDGNGPVQFFAGGDERFIDIHTDAGLPNGPDIEVCLPLPPTQSAADVRPVRVLHGEGTSPTSRVFVDRTSRIDHTARKACASVESFSKFAVVTSDVCGKGGRSYDGIVSIAGGLVGRKNVVVDGVTDCANFPANLPPALSQLCVPDADNVAGQCSVALTLGVNRGGCNQVASGDPHSSDVNAYSYLGSIRGSGGTIDLLPLFRPGLYALVDRRDATVGPVTVALPATRNVTKYKLRQSMDGYRPDNFALATDKDSVSITCIDPDQQ